MVRLRALREEAIQSVWADLPVDEVAAFTRFNDELLRRLRSYAESEE